MDKEKNCKICGKVFAANKYRPNQEICSSVECQYQRQLDNMAVWRKRNPKYFKYKETQDVSWKETCRQRSLEWRKRHKEYLKLYREAHKERHRNYMKEYMRDYRKKKKQEEKNEEGNV
ncbi:MAG: hypothetical protein ABID09_02735 [Candidatus Omnitrophota bacterium]